jgi:lipopolysaccharide/colanic/teichoic acid biosynthesis glycosyltransferase
MSLSENLERLQYPLAIRKPAPSEFPWLARYDLHKPLLRGKTYRAVKRLLDLSLVTLTSPIWLSAMGLITLFTAFTHPGEPWFVGEPRAGRGGRQFRMYRFNGKARNIFFPQLFNVLKGEMSLVGPRPSSYRPDDRRLWHTTRLDVPPGLTGLWWFVRSNSQGDDERLRLDIAYIDRRCITLDLEILLRSIFACWLCG